MNSQPPQPPTSDRDHLEELLRRIERLGVEVEHRSNLISIASRLHYLRVQETNPVDKDRLDEQLDAIMAVVEDREPHVPRSVDQHLDDATVSNDGESATITNDLDDLRIRLLDIAEDAVQRLAASYGGDAR